MYFPTREDLISEGFAIEWEDEIRTIFRKGKFLIKLYSGRTNPDYKVDCSFIDLYPESAKDLSFFCEMTEEKGSDSFFPEYPLLERLGFSKESNYFYDTFEKNIPPDEYGELKFRVTFRYRLDTNVEFEGDPYDLERIREESRKQGNVDAWFQYSETNEIEFGAEDVEETYFYPKSEEEFVGLLKILTPETN